MCVCVCVYRNTHDDVSKLYSLTFIFFSVLSGAGSGKSRGLDMSRTKNR